MIISTVVVDVVVLVIEVVVVVVVIVVVVVVVQMQQYNCNDMQIFRQCEFVKSLTYRRVISVVQYIIPKYRPPELLITAKIPFVHLCGLHSDRPDLINYHSIQYLINYSSFLGNHGYNHRFSR